MKKEMIGLIVLAGIWGAMALTVIIVRWIDQRRPDIKEWKEEWGEKKGGDK